MNPSERLLRVIQYLMAAGPEPVKQIDIRAISGSRARAEPDHESAERERLRLPHLQKTWVPNFRFIKNVPMSEAYLSALIGS